MKKVLIVVAFIATVGAHADVIKRGAPIKAGAPSVAFAKILESPATYAKTPVVVEGVVTMNCSNKGCWIQFSPEAGKQGMRMTFKDYAFFVPLDSKGMKARAEGVTSTKTLSKSHVDHLESEGAKLKRNADGSATEVAFIATGIELTKP